MIDLSIIIPVYNGEALLKRCLDSVFAQKTNFCYEIILVDDGSTDQTLSIASEYDIRILRQANAGPSKARNWGMKEAQGRYITLLDADDYWENSYVEKSVSFLDAHPECVAVNVICKNISVSGVSYTPNGYSPEKSDFFYKKSISLHNKTDVSALVLDDFYAFWAEHCHVGTCSTTIQAEVAKATLMREDLRISEDYEFWLMIAGAGKWGMIPEPLYVSDGTSTLVSQEAWLSRMKRRWENAPSLDVWESRIVHCYPSLKGTESFCRAEGRVSRNLTYCQLLSGRDQLARREALTYGKYFVQDPIGKLMNLCKWSGLSWRILCKFLRYREYHRFLNNSL